MARLEPPGNGELKSQEPDLLSAGDTQSMGAGSYPDRVSQFFRILAVPVMLVGCRLRLRRLAGFFGAQWWLFDVIASFRAQYAAILAVAAAVLALARWWVLAGSPVSPAAQPGRHLPVVSPRADTAEDSAHHRALLQRAGGNSRYRAVTDYIRRTGPDVVFLHEAYEPWEEAVEAADLGYDHQAGPRVDIRDSRPDPTWG